MWLSSCPRGILSAIVMPCIHPGMPCIIEVVGRTCMKVMLLACRFDVTMTGARPISANLIIETKLLIPVLSEHDQCCRGGLARPGVVVSSRLATTGYADGSHRTTTRSHVA